MTLRALDSGWYLTSVSRVAHYFSPWDANDFFSRSKCGQQSLANSLWKDKQVRRCKTCERIMTVTHASVVTGRSGGITQGRRT